MFVTTSQLSLAYTQAQEPDSDNRFESERILGGNNNREYLVK